MSSKLGGAVQTTHQVGASLPLSLSVLVEAAACYLNSKQMAADTSWARIAS